MPAESKAQQKAAGAALSAQARRHGEEGLEGRFEGDGGVDEREAA